MRRWLVFAAFLAACGGDSESSTPAVSYDDVTLNVACENGFDVEKLHANAQGLWATNNRGVYHSEDNGQTWQRFYDPAPFGLMEPDRARRPFPWQQFYAVSDSSWILGTYNEVLARVPNIIALTEDGGESYAVGVNVAETLNYQGVDCTLWNLSDGRVVFQYLQNWYLTTDGGATAQFLASTLKNDGRAVFYPYNPYRPDDGVPKVHYAADVEDARPICPSGPALEAYKKVCETGTGECTNYLPDGCFGGPLPGAVSSSGAYAVAVDRRIMWWDGAAWQFQLLPNEQPIVGVVDMWWAGGDLWVKYLDSQTSDPQTYSTFRIAGAVGGERQLQKVAFASGGLTDLQLIDAGGLSQGALVLRTTPSAKYAQNLVCRIAEGTTAELHTGTPTTFEPGKLYLHARRGRWSDMFDRFALQDDGHAYIASWRDFIGGVPPNNVLWNIQDMWGDTATLSGVTTNDGLKVLLNAFGERTDTPDLHLIDIAPGLGLPFGDTVFTVAPRDGFGPQPFGWVSAVSTIGDQMLFGTTLGTWPRRAATWTPAGRRPIPGVAVSTPFGSALTKSDIGPTAVGDVANVRWVTGIGVVSLLDGELPEQNPCGVEPVEAADCLVYPGEATAMSMDGDGYVYVVDGPRGQVLRKRAGDVDWVLVASHLMHPADIAIRQDNGRTRVYVLDGDVWVFEPSSEVAVRRAASAMSDYQVALADPAETAAVDTTIVRPSAACVAGAPCFSPPIWSTTSFPWKDLDGYAVLAGQTVCLSGQDFGSAGTLYLTGVTVATTSWSPSNICFESTTAPQQPKRGVLWIVRDDGVPSHVLPYVVDPESGPGQTSFRIDVPVPTDATPWIATSCRSSRGQGCTVAILGDLGLTPTATIDGQPAPLIQQSGGNFTFEWPAGLAPGPHELVVAGLTQTVELVSFDKTTLTGLAVDQIGVPRHNQAIADALGERFVVLRAGQYASPNGVVIPSAPVVEIRNLTTQVSVALPDDQFSLQEDLPRLVAHDGALFAVVRRASYVRQLSGNGVIVINDYNVTQPVTAGLYRLDDGASSFVALPDVALTGSTTGQIVGAGSTARGLVVVVFDDVAKQIASFVWDGSIWTSDAPVALDVQTTVVAGGRCFVVNDDGVFVLDLETQTLSGPFVVPGDRLMTLGVDGADALAVAAVGQGAEVFRLNLGTGAFDAVATLPDVAGVGRVTPPNRPDAVDGVTAVAGDANRIWVAVADRQGGSASLGLRLLRFENGQWTTSDETAGSFETALCLGPVLGATTGFCTTGDTMADGCTLFACQHGTGGFVPRGAWADTVQLLPVGGQVGALFESIYGQFDINGSGDAQYVTW
ncbi:MAG: hypothetical protein R3E66_17700 [bacterium]